MSDPATTPSAGRPTPLRWPWAVAALLVGGLLVAHPPLHIRSQRAGSPPAQTSPTTGPFDAAAFASQFWSGPLAAAFPQARESGPLMNSLRTDPATALRSARQVGLGNATYFFLRGSGRVSAVERGRIVLELDGQPLALRTGPVFGNVVRDGCGLLEVNQVPGLAEFNAVSAELNRLVETTVQPKLTALTVGATVTFVGCAEAPETVPANGPLLTLIPVHVEVKP